MLPPDVILLLRQVANSGFAPLDLMAEDCLKRYVPQVGPTEYKDDLETVTRSDLMMERMYGKETWTSMKAHWIKLSREGKMSNG